MRQQIRKSILNLSLKSVFLMWHHNGISLPTLSACASRRRLIHQHNIVLIQRIAHYDMTDQEVGFPLSETPPQWKIPLNTLVGDSITFSRTSVIFENYMFNWYRYQPIMKFTKIALRYGYGSGFRQRRLLIFAYKIKGKLVQKYYRIVIWNGRNIISIVFETPRDYKTGSYYHFWILLYGRSMHIFD